LTTCILLVSYVYETIPHQMNISFRVDSR